MRSACSCISLSFDSPIESFFRNIRLKYYSQNNTSKWQTMCPKSNVSQALIFSSCFRKDVTRGEYQHLFVEHNRAGRNRHQALSGSISKHERKKIVHIIAKDGELTFQNKNFNPHFPRWLSTILLFFINFSELRHVLSRWRDSSLYTKQEKQSGALKTQDHKSTGENTSSPHHALASCLLHYVSGTGKSHTPDSCFAVECSAFDSVS